MPKLAVFPKAYIDGLVVDGSMSLDEWIDVAATLDVPGLEFYSGMLDLQDASRWPYYRRRVAERGMEIPMLCCSPDFTHPDARFRRQQVDHQKRWIDMTVELGGSYCRVLSGQRRPELTIDEGVKYAADCILECYEYAAPRNIKLYLENHYKDNYWQHPEFAQNCDVFCQLVDAIDPVRHPFVGVNYDPSNAILAGEDPLDLLRRVKQHVITMHASDRYLKHGTIEELRHEEDSLGYASRLCHGEIGKGLNDYDAIFRELKSVNFDGWISIEDGVDGLDQLQRSVAFLKRKISEHWGPAS
jgi:sugar phosphate isomerase/epimerase